MLTQLMTLCTVDALPALPHNWWQAWSLAPATLLPWLALAVFVSRSSPPDDRARRWRAGGLALLAVALLSPLCRLGATLASGHMAQLMVLVAACALLAVGWRVPHRAGGHILLVATAAHGLLLWLWHLPAIYALALSSSWVHWGMTAVLAWASWAFFHQMLHASPAQRGAALMALLVTLLHTGLLGALLTFAGTPLYTDQAPGARAWGLSPLADQQGAGLLMWVPGGLGYMAMALGLTLRWGQRSDRRLRRLRSIAER